MILRRLRALTPFERRAALEAAVLVPAIRAALLVLPFTAVRGFLEYYARRFAAREAPGAADRVAWAVASVARRMPGTTCLPEALATYALLRRRLLPGELHFGIRDPAGVGAGERLSAHAWVESRGRVLAGDLPDLARFRPLRAPGQALRDGLGRVLAGTPVSWHELGTDPEGFIAGCVEQDLLGLVHQALSARPPAADWPPVAREELARLARRNMGAELVRGHEARRVLDALGGAGVRALLFKGTALAYAVYPEPALRPRWDTDLLIRERDREAARQAVGALGYEPPIYSEGEIVFRQFELQRTDALGQVHAFDFHWRISTQAAFAQRFPYDELAADAIPVPALGPHALTVGWPDALALSCLHPVMHHQNEERLLWVYDTHLLAARLTPADWRVFAERVARRGIAAICLSGLIRARARFGTAVPSQVLAALERAAGRGEETAEYLQPGRGWRQELGSSLRALGWRDRLRLLREVAFPSPAYMRQAYQLSAAASALLPLAYAHRGLRGIWRVVAGRK